MSQLTETTKLVVRLSPELHRAFRHETIDHGVSMREVVEIAIDTYLRDRRSGTRSPEAMAAQLREE